MIVQTVTALMNLRHGSIINQTRSRGNAKYNRIEAGTYSLDTRARVARRDTRQLHQEIGAVLV